MKTWIRERRAPASGLDGGVDVLRVRARQRGDGRLRRPRARRRARPRSRRATRSAKPASITSTPRRSSCCAISAFSSGCSAMPGDCSPSRSVVSKIVILRGGNGVPPRSSRSGTYRWCGAVGVCAARRVVEAPPRGGESRRREGKSAARSHRGRGCGASVGRGAHRFRCSRLPCRACSCQALSAARRPDLIPVTSPSALEIDWTARRGGRRGTSGQMPTDSCDPRDDHSCGRSVGAGLEPEPLARPAQISPGCSSLGASPSDRRSRYGCQALGSVTEL